jgi:hypothetical protein
MVSPSSLKLPSLAPYDAAGPPPPPPPAAARSPAPIYAPPDISSELAMKMFIFRVKIDHEFFFVYL